MLRLDDLEGMISTTSRCPIRQVVFKIGLYQFIMLNTLYSQTGMKLCTARFHLQRSGSSNALAIVRQILFSLGVSQQNMHTKKNMCVLNIWAKLTFQNYAFWVDFTKVVLT